jgi:diguanylate cyclase (GGDEF)-like protein
MENSVHILRDSETGKPKQPVLIMRDMNESKMQEERLTTQTLTDSLTGLPNRRAFDRALVREWKRTLRGGSQISLLLLDVDYFKEFNDLYGSRAADDCLRTVAAAVTGALRDTDIAARYGEAEIAMILPLTAIAGAVEVAEKIRSAVDALRFPHQANPAGSGWLTVSIGAAAALSRESGPINFKMPEGLLLAADSALYKARNEGRNRVATSPLVAPIGR